MRVLERITGNIEVEKNEVNTSEKILETCNRTMEIVVL